MNQLSPKIIDNIMFSREVHTYDTRNAHSVHTMYTRTKKKWQAVCLILYQKFGPYYQIV